MSDQIPATQHEFESQLRSAGIDPLEFSRMALAALNGPGIHLSGDASGLKATLADATTALDDFDNLDEN